MIQASARDPRLDFFRGLGMFIILIAHVPWNPWAGVDSGAFPGFSDAADLFDVLLRSCLRAPRSRLSSCSAAGCSALRAWFIAYGRCIGRISVASRGGRCALCGGRFQLRRRPLRKACVSSRFCGLQGLCSADC